MGSGWENRIRVHFSGHPQGPETCGTDPSLSKIIELARALDLDLQLFPRKALPAIQDAMRANELAIDPHDATSRASGT